MVVYQYGSAVLFNMEEHEVESYLGIIKKHASGLLHEMRKDGQCLYPDLPIHCVFFLAKLTSTNLQCSIFFPCFFFLLYLFILYIWIYIDHVYINDIAPNERGEQLWDWKHILLTYLSSKLTTISSKLYTRSELVMYFCRWNSARKDAWPWFGMVNPVRNVTI